MKNLENKHFTRALEHYEKCVKELQKYSEETDTPINVGLNQLKCIIDLRKFLKT